MRRRTRDRRWSRAVSDDVRLRRSRRAWPLPSRQGPAVMVPALKRMERAALDLDPVAGPQRRWRRAYTSPRIRAAAEGQGTRGSPLAIFLRTNFSARSGPGRAAAIPIQIARTRHGPGGRSPAIDGRCGAGGAPHRPGPSTSGTEVFMSHLSISQAKARAAREHPIIEHDTWNYSPPKLPRASAIEPGEIWAYCRSTAFEIRAPAAAPPTRCS